MSVVSAYVNLSAVTQTHNTRQTRTNSSAAVRHTIKGSLTEAPTVTSTLRSNCNQATTITSTPSPLTIVTCQNSITAIVCDHRLEPGSQQYAGMVGFGSKVGQTGPKWDKSGGFSDQISVHLAPGRQMH